MSALQNREVIFEFTPYGQYMRVMAMDVETLTEVIIQGPANAPESTLKLNALKRLEFVLRKKGIVA